MRRLKRREMLGKYRIDRKVGDGGFATVYSARDTVEGQPIALKLPREENPSKEVLADYLKGGSAACASRSSENPGPEGRGFRPLQKWHN